MRAEEDGFTQVLREEPRPRTLKIRCTAQDRTSDVTIRGGPALNLYYCTYAKTPRGPAGRGPGFRLCARAAAQAASLA